MLSDVISSPTMSMSDSKYSCNILSRYFAVAGFSWLYNLKLVKDCENVNLFSFIFEFKLKEGDVGGQNII